MKNKKKTVNGIVFIINEKGFVRTKSCGNLGHLEDCILLAETLYTLFQICDQVQPPLLDITE